MSEDQCDERLPADAVLARIAKAHREGRGVRLSADDLDSLSLSFLGELFSEYAPNHSGTGRD